MTAMGTVYVAEAVPARLELSSAFRILDAGYRQPQLRVAYTGLIAGNACSNILRTPGPRLGRHDRIANHRTGHSAHVGRTSAALI